VQEQQNINGLVDHLFRHESGKMVSVLTRIFGSAHIDLAEDVVQDAMTEAISQWAFKGIPDNPSAWLFSVAKNKALNALKREKNKRQYSSDIAHYLKSEWTAEPALNVYFNEEEIKDDQLRMMFTCCHPSVSSDSQIALTLKTLCGFSIPEIAKAFLTTEENIHKRLVRARQTIREASIPFEVPHGKKLEGRLIVVLETIYLLFNEGYSASKGNELIRYELCEEAMRLAELLVQSDVIKEKGNVYALLALMCLNASRFKARENKAGGLLTMAEQDRSLWDRTVMDRGIHYLGDAARGEALSPYHLLAAISAQHCTAPDFEATDWKSILDLYDNLLLLDPSPVVLLNRSIALSKVEGVSKALNELEKLKHNPALKGYYLFYSTQAELYLQEKNMEKARAALEQAIALAPLEAERKLLRMRLKTIA
jgi:RNA polymerase sigma factor (sigma-70 family)